MMLIPCVSLELIPRMNVLSTGDYGLPNKTYPKVVMVNHYVLVKCCRCDPVVKPFWNSKSWPSSLSCQVDLEWNKYARVTTPWHGRQSFAGRLAAKRSCRFRSRSRIDTYRLLRLVARDHRKQNVMVHRFVAVGCARACRFWTSLLCMWEYFDDLLAGPSSDVVECFLFPSHFFR